MNKAHMTLPVKLSSIPENLSATSLVHSPMVDVLQNTVTTKQWRRLVVRRRRERRGIILIFVVVLLMLLAIMGTAYLATSRADRTPIRNNGATVGSTAAPRLAQRTNLDEIFEGAQTRIKNSIIEDLFNVKPGSIAALQRDSVKDPTLISTQRAKAIAFASFRQEGMAPSDSPNPTTDPNHFYLNYDAPGRADPYLASLMPTKMNAAFGTGGATVQSNALVWPWISAPLSGELKPGIEIAPFFTDPRAMTRGTAPVPGFMLAYALQPADVDRAAFTDFAPSNAALIHNKAVFERADVPIIAIPMPRSATSTSLAAPESSKTTRVYPGLNVLLGNTRADFIAGDADGDGIADSGLSPVIINPTVTTGLDRYYDSANGVVYFVSYRVVDDSAKLNVNTALTARSDFGFPNGGTTTSPIPARIKSPLLAAPPVSTDLPNLGFYRSNIGLLELVRNTLTPLNAALVGEEMDRVIAARFVALSKNYTADTGPVIPGNATGADSTLRRLGFKLDPNFPTVTPTTPLVAHYTEGFRNTASSTAANPTTDWYYRFSSFGDSLEQTLARRPDAVGPLRDSISSLTDGLLVSLPVADTVSFNAGGGSLLASDLTTADTENALLLSTKMLAPNFSTSADGSWKWFPPSETALWYGWTKEFHARGGTITNDSAAGDDFKIALLDGLIPQDGSTTPALDKSELQYTYTPPASTGLAPVDLSRSLRGLLTTRSGVTSAVPKRYEQFILSSDTGSLPSGMPVYGEDIDEKYRDKVYVDPPTTAELALDPKRPYSAYPAERVSAATGTKEQLWRAYWSVMSQGKANGSVAVTWAADKFLRDKAATSTTGYVNYNGPEVLTDPYSRTYDAFLPPDRHYSAPEDRSILAQGATRPYSRINEKQMTLIRSAIAACNTVDLRDNDDDITAMTIDLGQTIERSTIGPPFDAEPAAVRGELYARIYGTERQLVISSVMIDRDAAGVYSVAVELFNPSDEPLRLDGYHLAVMNRGDTPAAPSGVTTNDGNVYVDNNAGAMVDAQADLATRLVPVVPGGTTLAPGGFIIIDSGNALPPDVLLPMAKPADPPVDPYDTTTPDPTPTALPTQIIRGQPMAHLLQLAMGRDTGGRLNRELALMRTRRADGEPYLDHDYTAGGAVAMETNAEYRRPTMNEDLTTVQGLASLVPVDGVDCRSLDDVGQPTPPTIPGDSQTRPLPVPPAGATRYWYMRMTTPPNRFTASADAWKCFYAGRFYEPRPFRISQKPDVPLTMTAGKLPQVEPSSAPLTEWAWKRYDGAVGPYPTATLGAYRSVGAGGTVAPGTVRPFLAPTIPIQNSKPYTLFKMQAAAPAAPETLQAYNPPVGDMDHPPFQFPYGSPFARNGDLLNVPFIGSYKIYRIMINGPRTTGTPAQLAFTIPPPNAPGTAPVPAPARTLYEYVPITMDAVNVAPDPVEWTTLVGTPGYSNPSVGRFDARETIYPRNDWAADLFDYVVARKSGGQDMALPDLPTANVADNDPGRLTLPADAFNDPMRPSTDQDGPILSITDAQTPSQAVQTAGGVRSNLTPHVPWLEWRNDVSPSPTAKAGPVPPAVSMSRKPIAPLATLAAPASKLIEGLININTAPPIVLRMLPWTVDPATGFVDQTPAAVGSSSLWQRQRVGLISDFRDNELDPATPAPNDVKVGRQHRYVNKPPFGFTSTMTLAELDKLDADDARTAPIAEPTPAGTPGSYVFNQQLMRLGMLNPMFRATRHEDLTVDTLNMNRVSNLTSQRSDVFTVYVTVQAWTYVNTTANPTAQQTDTRLVGERRGSFVVDRSRISQTNFKPSDLIVYPVEQE